MKLLHSEKEEVFFFAIAILALYWVGHYIPIPGVRWQAGALLEQSIDTGTFAASAYNLFTGGNLERFSIFALGICPYITASIYAQVVEFVWRLLTRRKDGRDRRWSIRVAGVAALLLCAVQANQMAYMLERWSLGPGGLPIVYRSGDTFRMIMVLTLTSGTACFMWLSDHITRRGPVNGMVLIFIVGIIIGLLSGPNVVPPLIEFMWLALAVAVVMLAARGYRRALQTT